VSFIENYENSNIFYNNAQPATRWLIAKNYKIIFSILHKRNKHTTRKILFISEGLWNALWKLLKIIKNGCVIVLEDL